MVFGAQHRYGPAIGTVPNRSAESPPPTSRRSTPRSTRPANAVLVVAGDVNADAVVPLLERALGGWKATAAAKPATLPARAAADGAPGVPGRQAGRRAVADPHRLGRRAALDAGLLRRCASSTPSSAKPFTSRLNNNLREDHGYAYGASSRFDMRLSRRRLLAAAGVQTDKTADALKEFFNELTRILEAGARPRSWTRRRTTSRCSFPRSSRPRATLAADAGRSMVVHELPDDYYTTYADRPRGHRRRTSKRAADKYIQPDKFAVVIVGDRKTIEAGVKALNLIGR